MPLSHFFWFVLYLVEPSIKILQKVGKELDVINYSVHILTFGGEIAFLDSFGGD